MQTRLLMSLAAALMLIGGIAGTFFAGEVLELHRLPRSHGSLMFLQMAGALYLAFAIMNWMARGNLIGGIHSRPMAVGNLIYFVVTAFAIGRQAVDDPHAPVIILAGLHVVFAAWFGMVVFGSSPAAKAVR